VCVCVCVCAQLLTHCFYSSFSTSCLAAYVRRKLKRIKLLNRNPITPPLPPVAEEASTAAKRPSASASTASTAPVSVPVSVPVLPSVALPPPMMRGWIHKEGGAVLRSFRARYFVLESTATSTSLTYYLRKTGMDSDGTDVGPPYGLNERGRLDLRGGLVTRAMQYSTVASAYGKKKYTLDLKSCPEADEWIEAFRTHIDFANHHESPTVAIPIPLKKQETSNINSRTDGVVSLPATCASTVKSPPALMRGWISKEGGAVRKSFNNRYFVLASTVTTTILTYYLNKAGHDSSQADGGGGGGGDVPPPYGTNERGKIDLRGGVFTQGTSHSTVASANGKQKYVLDLKSCSEGEQWVEALREHIEYANHQQTILDQLKQGDTMCSFKEMGV
jgi:hypothetical protein